MLINNNNLIYEFVVYEYKNENAISLWYERGRQQRLRRYLLAFYGLVVKYRWLVRKPKPYQLSWRINTSIAILYVVAGLRFSTNTVGIWICLMVSSMYLNEVDPKL